MVMIFSSPKALKHLLDKGEVYTFRTHKRKSKKKRDWVTDRRLGKKICDVEIEFVTKINGAIALTPYTEQSGFDSTTDWFCEIKRLNRKDVAIQANIITGYLYHVKKKEVIN